ncbi:efflux RND transporter periplasmic adaptor subunit [Aneurinibacillus migulanus]|jgi:multidrug resistance efflux pump|uniref:Barrel-sandwich domain of CusB or HlyD membrane-fusion n=1 Tax=Aneurinibacillus migulanus TaxID=47500 RepID=A0A0D1XY98_ANEMI|nr:efflux RND transporter periplasmic adaptor subunit [Aneurinibacillus migulanus]KIV57048.1 transporter [Aneurinibacillus migulanus]KON93225.1 transporter [Aneurinibacillus migulanus]MED0893082.1 efflux RND transporter periplasmic adaptor subunit [Aneurinibacillus migulanus]MED1619327.1 efflux RND transporter periplasmic adaptor subunit [Aneurinibacillus migulanus]CEH32428.1 Biotin-requiring enzyme [Aneurinibacillus migulanus]
MSRARFFWINVVIFLVIVGLAIGAYYYYFIQANYVSTDDAKITGQVATVTAQSQGKLAGWKGQEGQQVNQGDTMGQVNGGAQNVTVTAPLSGTVIQSKAMNGQIVVPGQQLAQIVDMKKLYVEANIEETNIRDVKVGADVDVTIDAEPGTKIKGKIEEVGMATNSMFSLMPQQNASGDYTKVVQRVPVKISMDSYPADIVPGMNATVQIHK